MTALSERWDYEDREKLDELCHAATVNPNLANFPWRQLSSDAQERLVKADKEQCNA